MSFEINQRLAWIDMEMTGLNPEQDQIIEIASVVTGPTLDILAEGPAIVVHQPEATLALMDAWNQKHHGQSGLISRVRASSTTVADAEQQTLEFFSQWLAPATSPICGNSIHQDRRFIRRYMPKLDQFLHYRCVDVSTIKELAMRWRPDIGAGFVKQGKHEALADILESIEELRYYREHFFIASEPGGAS